MGPIAIALSAAALAVTGVPDAGPSSSDGSAASPPAPHVARIQAPTWIRLPTGDDLASVYPERARQWGVGGLVRLRCRVTADGFLESCNVLDEAPSGKGFGAAALRLASKFRMTSKASDGEPVGGAVVIIPIRFTLSGR
jgi:protein TonB